jgi:predicted SnoaL-like aldol condensation-catalyzing enzyme
MRYLAPVLMAVCALVPQPAFAAACRLTPKQVVTRFMTEFYIEKKVRSAFERWVDPGYIQHPGIRYEIKRIIADGNLVAVHAHGRFSPEDRGMAVIDILRVEKCKVMEHWDVVQPVPEKAANTNGMF